MTTVSDGLYQYGGVPVGGGPVFATNHVYFVKPASGNDLLPGTSPAQAWKTLAHAISRMVFGDVVYMIAESNTASGTTDYQSATLNINVDGIKIIGVNSYCAIGQRSRIAQLSTATGLAPLVNITANGVMLANIEIFQGVADATSTCALKVSGQHCNFINCQISGIGDATMDVAGARSMILDGCAESVFNNCYIGLDTVPRATAAAEIELKGTANAVTRVIFNNCMINSDAGAATFLQVYAANANCVDRFVMFNNCMFANATHSGASTMTNTMSLNTSLGGTIILKDTHRTGTNWATTGSGVLEKVGSTES